MEKVSTCRGHTSIRRGVCVLGVLGLLIPYSRTCAENLIANGDFEQDLSVGWTQEHSGSYYDINRGNYDDDPDYEAYVYSRYGLTDVSTYAMLYQIVSIPITDISFSVSAKLEPSGGGNTRYGASAIIIYYLDSSDGELGSTRIYRASGSSFNWSNSPILHLIAALNTDWNDYSFNIQDELSNLSGVSPEQVAKLKVALYAYVSGCTSG